MRRMKAVYLIEFLIHALFWAMVYLALKALTISSLKVVVYHSDGPTQDMLGRVLFPHCGIVLGFLLLLFYGNIVWFFSKAIQWKSNWLRVSIIAGWWALVFVLNFWVVKMRVQTSDDRIVSIRVIPPIYSHVPPPGALPKPLPSPPQSLVFSSDDWIGMQPVMAAIFLSVTGIAVAYFFIRVSIWNDKARSQAEAERLSAEMRLLRSQVNPHFLFNTLNNLFSMAQKRDSEELADGIYKLSGMMRYMIYESDTDSVPLQKEIGYLIDCISLHRLRYAREEVSVSFRHPAPPEIAGIQVAPLLFIPFLENAFKHGVHIGHHCSIEVAISVIGKRVIFACENTDCSSIKRLEEKGGFGLGNVRRRLDLLYPGRHELRFRQEEGIYKVTLQITLPG